MLGMAELNGTRITWLHFKAEGRVLSRETADVGFASRGTLEDTGDSRMASRALVVCDVGQILIQSQMLSMALVASLRRQHLFPHRVILVTADGMASTAGHVVQCDEFRMLAAPSVASNGNLRSVAFLAAMFIPRLMNSGQSACTEVRIAARRQQPS
jgi:hypothetical protein